MLSGRLSSGPTSSGRLPSEAPTHAEPAEEAKPTHQRSLSRGKLTALVLVQCVTVCFFLQLHSTMLSLSLLLQVADLDAAIHVIIQLAVVLTEYPLNVHCQSEVV